MNQFEADLKGFGAKLSPNQGSVGGLAPVFSTDKTSSDFVPLKSVGGSFGQEISNKKQSIFNKIKERVLCRFYV